MTEPRVSVLINNYNYAGFVASAVKSALDQTHAPHQVIVVDDGSTDDSLDVLRGFGSAIELVEKSNGGQGSAYNSGFARSSADIVVFLDADDWLYPTAVARIIAAWRPGVSKIQFPLTLVDPLGRSLGRQVPRSMTDSTALELLKSFGIYNSPPGSGNAYASLFLRKILPMDEGRWRIAADTVPIVLAPALGDIVSIDTAQGAYRLHRSSDDASLLMNNAPADLWNEYERIIETKKFVAEQLSALALETRTPLKLAPWEARIATLCARFAGVPPARFGVSQAGIVRLAVRSLWRWPYWSFRQKTLQSVWMLGVLLLPYRLARRLALKHKASVGAPAPT